MSDSVRPAASAAVVSKSDTTNLAYGCRSLYVGGAGDVACVFADGAVVTFKAVPAGSVLPVQVVRVNSTNTTATDMVALF